MQQDDFCNELPGNVEEAPVSDEVPQRTDLFRTERPPHLTVLQHMASSGLDINTCPMLPHTFMSVWITCDVIPLRKRLENVSKIRALLPKFTIQNAT